MCGVWLDWTHQMGLVPGLLTMSRLLDASHSWPAWKLHVPNCAQLHRHCPVRSHDLDGPQDHHRWVGHRQALQDVRLPAHHHPHDLHRLDNRLHQRQGGCQRRYNRRNCVQGLALGGT